MRFSSGVIVGFAAGYYLGAKAGRERYHEIEAWLDQVRTTDAYQGGRDRVLTVAFTKGAPILEALDGATGGKASALIDRVSGGGDDGGGANLSSVDDEWADLDGASYPGDEPTA